MASKREYVRDQAEAASIAAALIKTTAESTATALNIQYIQKDILEIKQTLKDINTSYVSTSEFAEHILTDNDHENRIRAIEQNMWKWMGMSTILGAVASFLMAYALKAFV